MGQAALHIRAREPGTLAREQVRAEAHGVLQNKFGARIFMGFLTMPRRDRRTPSPSPKPQA